MKADNSFICPFCHAVVPEGALACPECGSDEQTGWSDDVYGVRSDAVKDDSKPVIRWIRIAFSILVAASVIMVLLNARMAIKLFPFLLAAILLLIIIWGFYGRVRNRIGTDLYAKLLFKARGDKALIERLVNYEKQKNPFRTRKQFLKDALERLDKDNR